MKGWIRFFEQDPWGTDGMDLIFFWRLYIPFYPDALLGNILY